MNPSDFHKIYCSEFPQFLQKYLSVPCLERLKHIGLLCGTDFTPLYRNRFYYSRLDHSVGTALIAWNFTHDKKQSISCLLHDVSTPVFSHANDFRKGDALTQEATEELNSSFIKGDLQLEKLLSSDNLSLEEVDDYHKYPVCDNSIPSLSCDRLEYMFPSGMALDGIWNLGQVAEHYGDIEILENECGIPELGFKSVKCAEEYTKNFCQVGLILLKNENRLAMSLLGDILKEGISSGIFAEQEFYTKSEAEILELLKSYSLEKPNDYVSKLYSAFSTMKEITRSETVLENHYCVTVNVKKRYINPLVRTSAGCRRIIDVSEKAKKTVDQFLSFEDSKFGCVPLFQKNGALY